MRDKGTGGRKQVTIFPDLHMEASCGLEPERSRGSAVRGGQSPLAGWRMSGNPATLGPTLNSPDQCFDLLIPTAHTKRFTPV